MSNVLFVSDSRGRGFKSYIKNHDANELHLDYSILPGRNLTKLANEVDKWHSKKNFEYTVIFGGICGLTEQLRQDRQQQLRYPITTRQQKVDAILGTINDLKARDPPNINICTIIPASLSKFYEKKKRTAGEEPDFQEEQEALGEDLATINDHIKQLNIDSNTGTIDLARRFYKSSLKRRRTGAKDIRKRTAKLIDTHLSDGIHLDKETEDECYQLILRNIKQHIQRKQDEEQERESEQNTSQESIEWDDFKRRKNNEPQRT